MIAIKKVKYLLFFLLIFNVDNCISYVLVRGCTNFGFFAEFLWTLNYLEWCRRKDYNPEVYWDKNFAYFSKSGFNGAYNAWEYYFEPITNNGEKNTKRIFYTKTFYNNDFTTIRAYWEYIKYLHLLPENEKQNIIKVNNHDYSDQYKDKEHYPMSNLHLYDTKFRIHVKEKIIDKYIKIKPSIQNKIDKFYNENLKDKKTVALHLRGKFLFNEVLFVSNDLLFEEANKYADKGYQFYIATDQYPLLEEARNKLKGKVIYYNCYRSDKPTSPFKPQQNDPQLGEDVLVETMLMSKCDHFIHTISLVSTAVLYFNPNLSHVVFY